MGDSALADDVMLLAQVDDIRSLLGYDDMADINAASVAALKTATVVLQSQLQTEFDKVTLTDTFYVESPGYTRGPDVQTEFRLTRGFVRSVDRIWYSDALSDFGLNHAVLDFATLALDAEKGVLRDYRTAYRRAYVQVKYTAGFDPDQSDPEAYDLTQVPEWLKQAALLRAQLYLAGNPTLEQANITLDTKMLQAELAAVVGRKTRYTPTAILPL